MNVANRHCLPALPHNELQIIRRIIAGESDLLPQLLAPYEKQLARQAARLLRCSFDIEDVLQETRWKVFLHLRSFRGESTFQTWLISLLLNECRMALRKSRRRLFVAFEEGSGEMNVKHSEGPLQSICREQAADEIRRRVNALPLAYRSVIEARFFGENTLEETSSALSLTPSAVKSRQFRALGLLRRHTASQKAERATA